MHHLFLSLIILPAPPSLSLFPPYPLPHPPSNPQVQDAVRCRMGGCKDDSENSPDSCKNGQVQIMVNSTPFHPTLQSICLRLTLTRLKLFPASSNSSRAKHDAIIDVIKLAPGFLVFSLTIFTLTGVHALSSVFFLYVTSSQKNEISLEACLVSSLKLMSAVSPTVPCYYIISLSFAVKTYSHSRLLTYEH